MARITDDLKDSTVKLRVNGETREYLDAMAKRKGISVSEYIRNLIKKDYLDNNKALINKNHI